MPLHRVSLPAGVVVGFYTGDPPDGTKIGEATTTKALYPLESEVQVVQPPVRLDAIA